MNCLHILGKKIILTDILYNWKRKGDCRVIRKQRKRKKAKKTRQTIYE